MAASTASTSTSISLGQYFQTPNVPNNPAQQQSTPNWFSRTLSGIQHYAYAPARHATEEAAQGLANRFSELFANNQEEITNRVRDVFVRALLRRCPENYHQLQQLIRTFLNHPTQADLDEIKRLLNSLSDNEIRNLAPGIRNEGVNVLTSLRNQLDNGVTVQPSTSVEISSVLVVNTIARQNLETAEAILGAIIENHEGALIQALSFLTQSMNDVNGPIHLLRQQLNHSQNGIIAEGLASLRRDLNARAHLPLRQTKDALEAYRSALSRNATSTELMPLAQNLREKLQLLLTERSPVLQIVAGQWSRLEQCDRDLQDILNHPATLSPHAQLLEQTDLPFQIITAVFNAQRGIIEEASDIIVEGIGRGVMHLETLPYRMYQHFISPQSPVSSQSLPATTAQPATMASGGATTAAETGLNFLNLDNIASQGRRFLDSILSSASGALSQQAASSLATLIRYTFEKIREHIQSSNEQQHLLTTINPMIQRLQGAIDRSSWGELIGVLQDAFQFMQAQQVYLQGLRLPLNPVRTNVSAIPEFIQNINAHQNVLRPPSQRSPQTISDREIQQQAQLLKNRSACIGPATLVLERFCKIKVDEALYAEIYKPSENLDQDLFAIFRQRLFEKIDQADLGFFSQMIKWSAKRVYELLTPLSSFYVSAIFDNVLNLIKNGIKKTPPSQESKEELFVKLARNWLAVTSGAYNQVAAAPNSQARDFNLMMEEAIKSPERNGGLKPNELFAAAAKTAIDSFGPRILWNENIDLYFNTQIPQTSPLHFLNPLVSGLNDFCSFTLKAVLFVPQWIGNQILQGGAKIALSHSPLLQSYSEQTIESFRRNTPTSYATQRLLYRQLQKILQLLQQSLNDDTDEAAGLRSRNTNIKRVEISSLVEYLVEVLGKSQYRTQDRLNNYLQHRGPIRDRVGRELDETFIPEVMETVVKTLSIVLKAITQEDEMQQMLYDGLCIANDFFEDKQPVSDGDFAAIERGIQELTDEILETAIFHAINEKFDFTNEKQKRGIAHFVRTMKEQSQTFANQIQQNIHEISLDSIAAPTLVSKVSTMIEHSCQFSRARVDALGKSDGNQNFHTETKFHLNQLSRQLLNHCNPIAQRLNSMKNVAEKIAFYDRLLPPLLLSFQTTRSLSGALQNQNLSSQDLTFCQTQLALLQQHLITLRRYQCPLPLTDEIQRYCRSFASSLQKIEKFQKAQAILRSASPLFFLLKQEKLNLGGQSPSHTLRQLERELCALLDTLPFPEQKDQLNQRILTMMLAQNGSAIDAAAMQFLSLHFQYNARNFNEENAELLTLRQTQENLQLQLNTSISDFSHQIDSDKSTIRRHCLEVANGMGELDNWVQAQHELPIWNLFIFDMQWVTETVKNLAFNRAQTKIKLLFESLYQRHNYLGFVNQVVLLPFLEKFGKHHLKK
jgi:hypothetical protein